MKLIIILIYLSAVMLTSGCEDTQGTDTGSVGIISVDNEFDPNVSEPETDTKALSLFSFENIGKDPNWYDTDTDNSLQAGDLTAVVDSNEGLVFSTKSIPSEISEYGNTHSHFTGHESHDWQNYIFSGKMMMEEDTAAIGLTFYSDYPNSDKYYRIRRYIKTGHEDSVNSAGFHFSAHPSGEEVSNNERCHRSDERRSSTLTHLIPEALIWYHFEIKITSEPEYTEIQAKIWSEYESKPEDLQIFCRDYTDNRLSQGTVGIWTGAKHNDRLLDKGEKYFNDFKVEFLSK